MKKKNVFQMVCSLVLVFVLTLSPMMHVVAKESETISVVEEETAPTVEKEAELVIEESKDNEEANDIEEEKAAPASGETVEVTTPFSFEDAMDPEEALEGYLNQLFQTGDEISAMSCGDKLSGVSKRVYDKLKAGISQIAAGEQTSPNITISLDEVGISKIYLKDMGLVYHEDMKIPFDKLDGIFKKQYGYDMRFVLSMLKNDSPYEFYWVNWSAKSGSLAFFTECEEDQGGVYMKNMQLTYEFSVGSAYADDDDNVDTSKIESAKAAGNNAKNIVADADGMSDAEKLKYYAQSICELADYNHAAAGSSYSGDKVNPWQMVWVFDNDPNTKVVCEGYAKALKYLCDNTDWSNPQMECYCVTGYMKSDNGNGGGHMWNIVHWNDGKNYLVDVTNCDTGSTLNEQYLYMALPKSGSVQEGYIFNNYGVDLSYTYDTDTKQCFSENELTLGVVSSGEDTPGSDTPGSDTPGSDTPGSNTPGSDTPGGDTPAEVERFVPVGGIAIFNSLSNKIAPGKRTKLTANVWPQEATNKAVSWSSSNSRYASVSADGTVTCYKAGAGKSVVITAFSQDGSGKYASYRINIMKGAIKSIKLKGPSKSKVKAGKTVKIKATVKTTNKKANKSLSWSSSNTAYAIVSGSGRVKLLPQGRGKTVIITARAMDGSGKAKSIKLKIK